MRKITDHMPQPNIRDNISISVFTFQAIVDTVTTTVPLAIDEITTAFDDIIKALQNIVKNPKPSMQTIGRGVLR